MNGFNLFLKHMDCIQQSVFSWTTPYEVCVFNLLALKMEINGFIFFKTEENRAKLKFSL